MTVFLLSGVTGNLGGAALRALLAHEAPTNVRVLLRSDQAAAEFARSGVRPHIADYSDERSLRNAMRGVDRMIFVSSSTLDPALRAAQHSLVVHTAVEAGVAHIVYTSGMGARHDPGHSAAEDALIVSGVGHTILRNALYSDPFVSRAFAEALEFGEIRSASEGGTLVTASIQDLGAAAATAALRPPAERLLELRGPEWGFDQLAQVLSHRLGREIRHREVTDQETGPFSVLFPLIRRGVFAGESSDLTALLERDSATIEDLVNQVER